MKSRCTCTATNGPPAVCVTNALQAWRFLAKRRRSASSLRKLYPHPPTRFFVLLPLQVSLVFHSALGVRLLLTPLTKLSWTSTMSRCALTSKTTSHPEARKQRKMPSASSFCSCLPEASNGLCGRTVVLVCNFASAWRASKRSSVSTRSRPLLLLPTSF